MEKTDLFLNDFIRSGENLTFLVGAGCSMDKPSCMPSGRGMLGELVRFMCPDSEAENLLQLENLRYESVVEEFRNQIDQDLNLIKFFEACDQPNMQHFFLASMLRKGHFLLTTNFDFLIEMAIAQSGVAMENIVPVITRSDFEQYSDPTNLRDQGKIGVYKIHGSTRNFVTGEETRSSVIATLQAFGANKEGLSVFQVESFKQPLFTNITRQRSLVVMGYSGGDDFDVIPTLKALSGLKNVLWLNFVPDDGGIEKIYEITENTGPMENANDIKQILADIKRLQNAEHVYWVDVTTSRAVDALMDEKPQLQPENCDISIKQWLLGNIPVPTEWYKYQSAYMLYLKRGHYDEALRCAETMLALAETPIDRIAPVENIARIYLEQGKYNDALVKYQEAFSLVSQVNDMARQANYCNNIGELYRRLGNVTDALKWYSMTIPIADATGDIAKKASALVNIGKIYSQMGQMQQALNLYNEALQLTDQRGNLSDKAQILNNIATAHVNLGNFAEALNYFKIGLEIAEKLGDQERTIRLHSNIGNLHVRMGNYSEGLENLEKGLQAADAIGDVAQKATILNNIGSLFKVQENYKEAIDRFNVAIQIADQLGDRSIKLQSLLALGETQQKLGDNPTALEFYGTALQVAEELNSMMEIGTIHNNLGTICREQGNLDEALVHFQRCLDIAENCGYQELKAYSFKNIGMTYFMKDDDATAMENYNKSLQIAQQYPSLLPYLFDGMGDCFKRQGDATQALAYFTQALQVLQGSGLETSKKALEIADKIKALE